MLGAEMDLVKPAEVFHFAQSKIAAGGKAIIANHNLHSLYFIRHSEKMRRFYEIADLIEVDSIPIIAWARLIGRRSRTFHRCTYLDWREDFWRQASEKGWRVFFVGGADGVAVKAKQTICARWPQAQLEVHHGYFRADADSAENQAVIGRINAFKPDVILVGLGMPRQEAWVVDNYDRLERGVVFTVGGAFDYEAGVQWAAPRWTGRIGAEWAFRLVANPRRMFRRYCIEPWSLAGAAAADLRATIDRRFGRRA